MRHGYRLTFVTDGCIRSYYRFLHIWRLVFSQQRRCNLQPGNIIFVWELEPKPSGRGQIEPLQLGPKASPFGVTIDLVYTLEGELYEALITPGKHWC